MPDESMKDSRQAKVAINAPSDEPVSRASQSLPKDHVVSVTYQIKLSQSFVLIHRQLLKAHHAE